MNRNKSSAHTLTRFTSPFLLCIRSPIIVHSHLICLRFSRLKMNHVRNDNRKMLKKLTWCCVSWVIIFNYRWFSIFTWTTDTITIHSNASTHPWWTCKSNAKMMFYALVVLLNPLSYWTVVHSKCNILFICLWICSKPAKRSTFSSTRRTATFMDKCRIDRGIASRVEQENDHEPGVASIWHTIQFAADVCARKIR